jgi:hypothetical protein
MPDYPLFETVLGFLSGMYGGRIPGYTAKIAGSLQENSFRKHERRADTPVIVVCCLGGAWREIPPNVNQ